MNLPERFFNAPRAVVTMPTEVVRAAIGHANGFFDDVLEILAPTHTSEEFVNKLQREAPQKDLEIGINALRASRRALHESLALHGLAQYTESRSTSEKARRKLEDARVMRSIGFGMMKHAAVKAEVNESVPDHVTRDVTIDAIVHGALPHKKGFVSEEMNDTFADVYEKHNNIISLNRAG